MDSSDEAIPESNLAPHGTEESEKWDQEQAEAREQAPKQAEQDPQNEEAQEEDGDGKTLNEEQRASLEQFLGQLTRENWRQTRAELLSAYQNGLLPRNRFVENQFWRKVGEIGGKELAMELLQNSDPAFSKVLEGWGKRTRRKFLITSPSLISEALKSKNTWKRPIPVNTPLWINSRTA